MADTKSQSSNQPASQKGGQSSTTNVNMENLRNLALILGITLLLILAVILIGFFIAGLANSGKTNGTVTPDALTTITNGNGSSTTAPTTTGSNTNTLGSLGGGIADTKPDSSATPAPVTPTPTPAPAPVATPAPAPATITEPEPVINPPVNPLQKSEYTFTAGSGDSVSWLARRAMYAYMGDRGLGLDRGQRLYFETMLTQQSNPAAMNIGETRTFSAETMHQIFTAATHLSGGELSSWNSLAVQSGYT